MDCADEVALVRKALAPHPAVHGVEFDLIHGNVDITFDAAVTNILLAPSPPTGCTDSWNEGRC